MDLMNDYNQEKAEFATKQIQSSKLFKVFSIVGFLYKAAKEIFIIYLAVKFLL